MKNYLFNIKNIPVALWGDTCEKVIIAIHGDMSNKLDIPIQILSQNAIPHDFQVLSFDLPKHGNRKNESEPSLVQDYLKDLTTIMEYSKENWKSISLFANSIGAYFSLLAYKAEDLKNALFLSPVVDMKSIIEDMMQTFNITEQQLSEQKTISTPIGKTLYWDYYNYVKTHPIDTWNIPTKILYGENDSLCKEDLLLNFTKKFSCELEISPNSQHFFHTTEDLHTLDKWIKNNL